MLFSFSSSSAHALLGRRRDVVRAQAMIGDKAVVIQLFARFGIDHRELKPIDRQGIVTTTQEDVIDVTIQRHFREAAVPTPSCTLGQPSLARQKANRL